MYYIDRTTKEYPLDRWQVMSRNPSISSAINWDDATLEALNVYPVWAKAADVRPNYDQKCVEGAPQEIDGQWYQSWVLVSLTPDELKEATDQQWDVVRTTQQILLNQNVIVQPNGNVVMTLHPAVTAMPYVVPEIDSQIYVSYIESVNNATAISNPFEIKWPADPFMVSSTTTSVAKTS